METTPLLSTQQSAEPDAALPSAPCEPHSTPAESQTLTDHELGAWIIDETLRGVEVEQDTLPRTRAARRAYLFYTNSTFVRQIAAVVLVFLSFFEVPAWCGAEGICAAPDGSELYMSGTHLLSAFEQALINGCSLAVLIFFAVFDWRTRPRSSFHENYRMMRVLLFLLALDFVWVASYKGYPPFRPAPFLRALLPLFYWRALHECAAGILAVLYPFCEVIPFVALFVFLFGWVTTLLFHDEPAAERYFGDLTTGLYSSFTSVTTADWPMSVTLTLVSSTEPDALGCCSIRWLRWLLTRSLLVYLVFLIRATSLPSCAHY